MTYQIIKIYENGSEAISQEFVERVQAELYLMHHAEALAGDGHEIIEDGEGVLVARVNGQVFRYEVREWLS